MNMKNEDGFQCFLVQLEDGIEVYKIGEETTKMLDRCLEIVREGRQDVVFHDSSKKQAGMLLDGNIDGVFPNKGNKTCLRQINFHNQRGYSRVTVFLGRYGQPEK